MKSSLLSLPFSLIVSLAAALCARGAADYATPYVFTTVAGISSIGNADGTGAAARFYSPQDITTDAAGNAYVVDEGNHTIRKITPAGAVTTFAGTAGLPGSADGTGAAARFDSPQGIVADATGNLFVADTGNHTIRKITPAGVVTTFAGLAGVTGSTDGTGGTARFNLPRKIAVDASGNLFVTEIGNRAIRKVAPAGGVTTFATGLDFQAQGGLFAWVPVSYGAIAVDASGSVYVSYYVFTNEQTHAVIWGDNHSQYVGYVAQFAPDGTRTANLWQTSVFEYFDGRVFNGSVSALAFDSNGQLIVANPYAIDRYAPTQPDASFTLLAGGSLGGTDGTGNAAKFGFPLAIAYDRTGTLYIADTGNNTVRKLSATGTVTTIAGVTLESATTTLDGTGAAARFANPTGTAVDAAGNVYVADTAGHCIRKITPAGVVTTFAGAPGEAGSADGMGTAARFNGPVGLAITTTGILYVADTNNHTIRLVSATGETTTFAGLATATGWYDGQGIDARFMFPRGVAVDAAGNVYVTSAATVRKIDPSGNVTTLAGFNSESGYVDATGTAARFTLPYAIAVDGTGNVYVTDAPDSPAIARIRKITPAGDVTTVAGAEHGYADGSATTARFHNPYGLAIDASGNLFVAENYNQTVRKVTPQGAVSTVAGLADAPGSTDGAGRDARFYCPQGIAVDATGALYVSSGTTVRKGQLATGPVITQQPQSQTVTSGNNATFSVTAGSNPSPTYQWYLGGTALSGATGSSLTLSAVRTSDAGDYTVVVTNSLGSATSSKATLTVNAATTTPTTPTPTGGGGGGGAPSTWFFLALSTAAGLRRWCRRQAGS